MTKLPIMSPQEWLKLTDAGRMHRRSAELKRVDAALQGFHARPVASNRKALEKALAGWKKSKGPGWKDSVRNKSGAVQTLQDQLSGKVRGPRGADEMLALSAVRDEARAIVTDLFRGQRLVYRPGLWTKVGGNTRLGRAGAKATAGSAVHNARKLHKAGQASGSDSGKANRLATGLLDRLVPSTVRGDVMGHLTTVLPGFMREYTAAALPFVGVGVAGAGAVTNAGMALKRHWDAKQAQTHAQRTLSSGNPDQAFQGIIRMLERERTEKIGKMGIGIGDFTAKLTGVLVDGGTVTNAASSLAASLAKLTLLVGVVTRDALEARAVNDLMAGPRVDGRIFQACPLIGAYFVLNVPTSVLVNVVLEPEEFFAPGMKDKVERAVKRHVQPLQGKARSLVLEHRMHFPSLGTGASHATAGGSHDAYEEFVAG